MADKELINRILKEYEEKRTVAAAERNNRIARVYEAVPRIMEIDNEIFSLGMENTKRILKSPDKGDEYNREFKEKLNILTSEKKKLLDENNIPADYDRYKYSCSLCSDTGFLEDGKKCSCFEKQIKDNGYYRSNIGQKLLEQNFSTFSFEFYSKEKANNDISPYENIKRIFNGAKAFCEDFDKKECKNLFFHGNQGLGKTFLSSCIAKELIDKGKDVIYLTASKIFIIYEDYKFGKNTDRKIIDDIYNCDLLIIDDLGTEYESKLNNSFLFDILNERLISNKKMIISTNLNIDEIDNFYSRRFTSRLFEYFIIYNFFGDDIRLKMLSKK